MFQRSSLSRLLREAFGKFLGPASNDCVAFHNIVATDSERKPGMDPNKISQALSWYTAAVLREVIAGAEKLVIDLQGGQR